MKHNYFLKTIFVTCLFVSILKNEKDIFYPFTNSPKSFSKNIELVVQANPNFYSAFLNEAFLEIKEKNGFSVLFENNQSNLCRFNHPSSLVNQNYCKYQQICSIHQIIAILQKKNSWHQSADENHSDIV